MPNPLILPCPTSPAACFPCFVSPLANTSQEGPDGQVFLGISFDSQQPPILPKITNQTWKANGCQTLCTSTISQEDATQCADRANSLCFQTGPPNDDGPPGPQLFLNNKQTCQSFCPDGLPFSWTVIGGTFYATSQILADLMAFTWACYKARQHKLCLGSLPTQICVGQPFTGIIKLSGGVDDPSFNFWTLPGGAGGIPPGLTFNGGFNPSQSTITGTPTVPGIYSFQVEVITLSGDFMTKTYSICVIGINPSGNILPAGTVGQPYSQPLTLTNCAVGMPTWTVSAGGLPPGIILNPNGNLVGNPTGLPASYNFTVQAAVGTAVKCSNQYFLTVNASSDTCCNTEDWLHSTDAYNYFVSCTTDPIPQYMYSFGAGQQWAAQGNSGNDGIFVAFPGAGATLMTMHVNQANGHWDITFSRPFTNPNCAFGVYNFVSKVFVGPGPSVPIPNPPATVTVDSCGSLPQTLTLDAATVNYLNQQAPICQDAIGNTLTRYIPGDNGVIGWRIFGGNVSVTVQFGSGFTPYGYRLFVNYTIGVFCNPATSSNIESPLSQIDPRGTYVNFSGVPLPQNPIIS